MIELPKTHWLRFRRTRNQVAPHLLMRKQKHNQTKRYNVTKKKKLFVCKSKIVIEKKGGKNKGRAVSYRSMRPRWLKYRSWVAHGQRVARVAGALGLSSLAEKPAVVGRRTRWFLRQYLQTYFTPSYNLSWIYCINESSDLIVHYYWKVKTTNASAENRCDRVRHASNIGRSSEHQSLKIGDILNTLLLSIFSIIEEWKRVLISILILD